MAEPEKRVLHLTARVPEAATRGAEAGKVRTPACMTVGHTALTATLELGAQAQAIVIRC
jgi:hypothetical protein